MIFNTVLNKTQNLKVVLALEGERKKKLQKNSNTGFLNF